MTASEPSRADPAPPASPALPLEELELTPQWVKAAAQSYAHHAGQERAPQDRDRGRAFPAKERKPKAGQRPAGPHRKPLPSPAREGRRAERGGAPQWRAEVPVALPVQVSFVPEEKGFAAMIEAMKHTGRAYALFDVAKLVLNKPERHHVKLSRKPQPDGSRPPLYVVKPSENVFLHQDEAVRFVLRHHAEKIFRETRKPVEPPKGNFTFVNRCGFTGEWLGPPNYHGYQSRLVRHHQSRLAHVPFERFKAKIQTVKDPQAVKAWVESMSVEREFECMLDPEPKAFKSREALEKHFVETHLSELIEAAPEVSISGPASRQLQHKGIHRVVRQTWESERRFPLNTANALRGRLRHEGFHFFKNPKGITYVSRIRPKRFESIDGLAEHVRKIVAYLRAHPHCHRKELFEHLMPAGEAPSDAAAAALPATWPGEAMLLADLHWLIQDGYVIEFSDGRLWMLPEKPPQKPAAAAAAEPVAKPASCPAPVDGGAQVA